MKKQLEKLKSLLLSRSISGNISNKNVNLCAIDQSLILEQNIPNPCMHAEFHQAAIAIH